MGFEVVAAEEPAGSDRSLQDLMVLGLVVAGGS